MRLDLKPLREIGDLLAIDPGLRHCGVASFRQGRLVGAALVQGAPEGRGWPAWITMTEAIELAVADRIAPGAVLVLERPQVYAVGMSKGDPDDLLELTGIVGAVAARLEAQGAHVTLYKPREWKGQVPKAVHNERVRSHLDPEELRILDGCGARSLIHNVTDAVGIGLFHLRRRRARGGHA